MRAAQHGGRVLAMPNRIEREIEEILTRLDEFVPNESRTRRVRRRGRALYGSAWDRIRAATSGITSGHVLLAAVLVLVASFFLKGLFPTFFRFATYAAVAVLFGAIILSIRPVRRRRETYWRGQPVDIRRPNVINRIRWWWRRRGGRY